MNTETIRRYTPRYFYLSGASLVFCMLVYIGVFDIGHHGDYPVIVLFTSGPATIVFLLIFLASLFMNIYKEKKWSLVYKYYIAIALNIFFNAASTYALYLSTHS